MTTTLKISSRSGKNMNHQFLMFQEKIKDTSHVRSKVAKAWMPQDNSNNDQARLYGPDPAIELYKEQEMKRMNMFTTQWKDGLPTGVPITPSVMKTMQNPEQITLNVGNTIGKRRDLKTS